jgi:NAD(P)H dehydrogenase (quinone)
MTAIQKPKVLVLGVSGQIGRFVLEQLDKYPETLSVRSTARRPEQVAALQQQGRDAVLLDLDNPTTFAAALHGVDRVFLLTGWDCTDPLIAWHQLVETYIEASGISWTHIHPNMFMEQIPKFMKIRNDRFPIFWGPGRMGWIAAQDVGSVVATVLREGPAKHGGQNYWLSAKIAGGEELATIFSEVLGRPTLCDYKKPEDFAATMELTGDYSVESWYAAGRWSF